MRWSCLGRTVEKGGTIRMFCEEEIAHLLSKNMERTERIHFDRCHLLFKTNLLDLSSLFVLNLPRNRQIKIGK